MGLSCSLKDEPYRGLASDAERLLTTDRCRCIPILNGGRSASITSKAIGVVTISQAIGDHPLTTWLRIWNPVLCVNALSLHTLSNDLAKSRRLATVFHYGDFRSGSRLRVVAPHNLGSPQITLNDRSTTFRLYRSLHFSQVLGLTTARRARHLRKSDRTIRPDTLEYLSVCNRCKQYRHDENVDFHDATSMQ